jgi:DNA-binding MarR family transcriptional regulator
MNHQESIGKHLSYIYRMGQCYIGKELDKYNIGKGQYIFLFYLYKNDGINQEALTDIIKVDKATTGRAIQKLEKAGFVVRHRNPEDKRAYKVFLTEKGQEMRPFVCSALKRWVEMLLKDFTEEEKELMLKLLKKMFENMDLCAAEEDKK